MFRSSLPFAVVLLRNWLRTPLVAALKAAGTTDITYKRYTNDSGHAVFQRNAEETHPLMEAFFARTLQNPSPGKGRNRSKSSASIQATPPR